MLSDSNLIDLLNQSINETLPRTLKTSVTTLLALIAIYFFGGEILKGFSFALIWGVIVGTYSSIFIASPIILIMNIKNCYENSLVYDILVFSSFCYQWTWATMREKTC